MKIKKLFLVTSALACTAAFMAGCNNKPDPTKPGDEQHEEEATLVSISATMNKTTYVEGDLLSLAGLKVVAHYSDETEKEITGYTVNHQEGHEVALGDKVVITLGDKTCEIALTVTERGIVLESITAALDKTSYYEGEKLGQVTVQGHYSNGTNKEITSGYTLLMNGKSVGATHTMVMAETELVVSYEGLTSNKIAVEVKEDVAVSIAVSNNFREFAPNAQFVKETVTATYASGKTADVTAKCTFSGYDMATEDTYEVLVEFGELETSYEIKVDMEFDTRVMVSISADSLAVERHDNVNLHVSLRNAELTDVTYTLVSGPATVSTDGVVTIKDDAAVGAEIKVSATAKEVTSNVLTLTVGETLPTTVSLAVDTVFLKDNATVTLTPTFTPAWATSTEVEYTADKDYVSISNGVVSLKEGVSEFDHVCEKVTITAKCFENEEATATKELTVGYDDLVISVDSGSVVVGRDSIDNLKVGVSAIDGNHQEVTIDTSKYTFTSSNTDVLTVGEHTGVITVVGHGTAKITATVGSKSGEADFTVVVPPEEITVNGYNNIILDRGLKTGVGEANKIKAPFISTRNGTMPFSTELDYSFKLLDQNDQPVEKASDEIATVDEEGYITFKVQGKILAEAKSNSAIGKVDAGEYEATKTAKYIVNDLTNIYKQEDLHFALYDPEVKGVNIMKDIMFQKMLNVEVEGEETTYSSYWESDGNEKFIGFTSRGDKIIQGNGYKLSLEELELAQNNKPEAAHGGGDDLLVFAAENYNESDTLVDDVIGEPYHVEVHDFSIIGQSDYQGDYVGKLPDLEHEDVAANNFRRSFRRGMRVGVENNNTEHYKAKFDNETNLLTSIDREYQKCAKAYVDAPKLENVTVQGFETGIRSEHVVNGSYTGLNIKDCYNNATEVNQCIVEYKDITIRQVGGFVVEIVPDGINMKEFNKDTCEGIIGVAQAGENYDQLPEIKMTGKTDCLNLNNGTNTEKMATLKVGDFTIDQILGTVITDTIIQAGSDLIIQDPAKYSFLGSMIETVVGYVSGELGGIVFNKYKQADFFTLMFLAQYNLNLKSKGKVLMGLDACNFRCDKDDSGTEASVINLYNLIKEIIEYYVKTGGTAKYEGYKKYNYILIDLTGTTVEAQAANLGSIVVVNLGYDASYIAE